MTRIQQHPEEVLSNQHHWYRKPVLREIYRDFYRRIATHLRPHHDGLCVEIGSGLGNIKEVIPHCLRTDIFDQPWLDSVENAYRLSFADNTVGHLILFDVFHHLRYPGNAFAEFDRVLQPGGRVILFEPCVSLLGRLVYGPLHPEPLGLAGAITWNAPTDWKPDDIDYYAAQGNAWRMFVRRNEQPLLENWKCIEVKRLSAISYVGTGGYSGPQLYPVAALPLIRLIDRLCDLAPALFATRLLVVLEKNQIALPGQFDQRHATVPVGELADAGDCR